MSPQSSETTPDIFVGLLFVSVAALLIGCLFLALELNVYDWKLAP